MYISYDYYRVFYYVAKTRQCVTGGKAPAEQPAESDAHHPQSGKRAGLPLFSGRTGA